MTSFIALFPAKAAELAAARVLFGISKMKTVSYSPKASQPPWTVPRQPVLGCAQGNS